MDKRAVEKPSGIKRLYYDFIGMITFVPDGYKFVLGFLVASFLLVFISTWFSLLAFLLAVFSGKIFHLPNRINSGIENAVVSPADGKIEYLGFATLPEWLQQRDNQEYLLISIRVGFLDTRINVIPVSGYIEKQVYQTNETSLFRAQGRSGIYESNVIFIKEGKQHSRQIIVEQKAGFLKRSVVSFMYENDLVRSSEVFGILRFGKYVDIYLPAETEILVAEGQTLIAGETILGLLSQLQLQEEETKQLEN